MKAAALGHSEVSLRDEVDRALDALGRIATDARQRRDAADTKARDGATEYARREGADAAMYLTGHLCGVEFAQELLRDALKRVS